MKLRPYQHNCIKAVFKELKTNDKALVELPVASGKTIIFTALVEYVLKHKPDFKAIILVNRNVLIQQTADKFNIPVGIFSAGEGKKELNYPITIAIVQSLANCDTIPKVDTLIVDECFDKKTEILTENGFIRFPDLKDELVAQVDQQTHEIDFVKPEKKIEKKYSGKMIKFKNNNIFDVYATENHEMLIRKTLPQWIKEPIKDVSFNTRNKMVTSGFTTSEYNELSNEEKLLIMFQADGAINSRSKNGACTLTFSFKKERKIKEFIKLMQDGKFKYSEVKPRPGYKRFLIRVKKEPSKDLTNHFKNIKDISLNKAKEIIEYMVLWDGHKNNGSSTSYLYSSKIENNINFYQSICCLCGYKTKITRVIDNRKDTYSDIYRLFILKNNIVTTHSIKKTINYVNNKSVYCVRVPKGNIIIRRKGKTLVVGNCHSLKLDIGLGAVIYKKLFFPKVIGFSGTVFRPDGRPIYGTGEFFNRPPCYSKTMREMTNNGYLAPLVLAGEKEETKIDVSSVKKHKNDYVILDLERVILNNKDKVRLQAEDIIKRTADRKKVAILCVSIKHAEMMLPLFDNAVILHSNISKDEQAKAKAAFTEGDAKYIISVLILAVGWDYPPLDAVAICRPTRSRVLFVQSVGRAARKAPGKENGLILDYGNIINNLGHPYDIRASHQKQKKPTVKMCINCLEFSPSNSRQCHCGKVFMTMCAFCFEMKPYGDRCKCGSKKQVDPLKNLTVKPSKKENCYHVQEAKLYEFTAKSGRKIPRIDYYIRCVGFTKVIASEFIFNMNYELAKKAFRKPTFIWVARDSKGYNKVIRKSYEQV